MSSCVRLRSELARFFVLLFVCLVAWSGGAQPAGAQVDVAFLIDGSGSIDAADFELERQGLITALENSLILPRNGTVAVTVVQFASSSTRLEVPYTLISGEADVDNVVDQLLGMVQIQGLTNPGDGVERAMAILNANGNPAATQSICLATDGLPNAGVDVQAALVNGQASAIGLDRFGVIAVEDPPNFFAADFQAFYGPLVFGGANVTVVRNAAEFANTVGGACLPSNLSLVGLEVNQAIQDWSDSVQMIEGKTTFVRAHVESASTSSVVAVARLRGFRGGTELTGSPLVPINTGGSIIAPTDAAAVRNDFNSSLNFRLPASWLNGTVTLTVEGVGTNLDCQEAADTPGDCMVRVTFDPAAVPEVRYVRIRWSQAGNTFEVTDLEIDELVRRQIAISPAATVDAEREFLDWSGAVPPDLVAVNERLESMRFWDLCWPVFGCDRLYYGALKGPSGGGGRANDIPGTVSSGFLPFPTANSYGRNRHVHEIAHTLGLSHAPFCGAVVGPGVTPLPYDTASIGGRTVATLGPMNQGEDRLIYGFDTNALNVVDPNQTFEMLSYCGGTVTGARWISKVTYDALLAATDATFLNAPPAPKVGVQTEYLVVRGSIDFGTNNVQFLPFGTITSSIAPPQPLAGDYTLRLLDGLSQVISEVSFQPSEHRSDSTMPEGGGGDDPDTGHFLIPVPANPAIQQAMVLQAGNVLATRVSSGDAPLVQVTSPNGGEILAGDSVSVEWQSTSRGPQPLTYLVQYSRDGGTTWKTLVTDWPGTSYEIERRFLAGSSSAIVRVMASDGFNARMDSSDGMFEVANNPPEVAIRSPRVGDSFFGVQLLFLEASVQDREDGELGGTDVVWGSDLDGFLGSGRELSVVASDLSEGDHVITATATDSSGAATSVSVPVSIGRIATPVCVDGDTVICLNDSRFRVELVWRDFVGQTGSGRIVQFRSDDSGLMWFFDADNWELLVKVLDGCGINDRLWVFAAATTDVEFTLNVTDTLTGASRSYFNPLGIAAPALTDTDAFATCSATSSQTGSVSSLQQPESDLVVRHVPAPHDFVKNGCTPTGTNLCLNGSRFEVELQWRDFSGNTGSGNMVPFGSDDSGLMWFFDADNWELLVKVLDGCGINDRFWVFGAATTDVEYTLTVTDTETGAVSEYFNPLGAASAAITDTDAFDTCP